MKTHTIGIVGFGRFGKVIHRLFESGFNVIVNSSKVSKGAVNGIIYDTLETVVATSDAVFLTVPINRIGKTAHKIKPYLRDGQVVVDVCSVKEMPNDALRSVLADIGVTIWSTHPMFGPDSTKSGFGGLVWVSCEDGVDSEKIDPYTTHIKKMGLRVVKTSCALHDEMAARTQGLTHFIGRFLDELQIAPTAIDTVGYKRLMAVRDQTCNDTWELFCDLQYFNRFSDEVHQHLLDAVFTVLSRFLDTIPQRTQQIVAVQDEDDVAAKKILDGAMTKELGGTSYQLKLFDNIEEMLKQLFLGSVDFALFRTTKKGVLDVGVLDAMGAYVFQVIALLKCEQGETFVWAKRRSRPSSKDSQ